MLRNSTVEASKRLRASDFLKGVSPAPGMLLSGRTHWVDGYTGRVTGEATFDVEIGEEGGTMRLRLALADAAGGLRPVGGQHIELVASPQPSGGQRWRFLCPRTGDRCEVLLCPSGASSFAGRGAWRLSYLSQRRSLRDRPLERARGIRMALGGSANMMHPFPPKPKGMWQRTYDRLRAKAGVAETASLGIYAAKLDAWMPGWRERAKRD